MLYSKHIEKKQQQKTEWTFKGLRSNDIYLKKARDYFEKKNSGPIQFNLFNPKYEKFP